LWVAQPLPHDLISVNNAVIGFAVITKDVDTTDIEPLHDRMVMLRLRSNSQEAASTAIATEPIFSIIIG
jgi:hypothetical protein